MVSLLIQILISVFKYFFIDKLAVLLIHIFYSTIGPIIGFGGALYLFDRKIDSDKRKEDDDEKKKAANKIKNFLSLLEEIVKKAKKQNDLFREYSGNLSSQPYLFNHLFYNLNVDLDRYLRIDYENMRDSFLLIYGSFTIYLSTNTTHFGTSLYMYVKGDVQIC